MCLAESQLGWIPYVLSRADFVWREMRGEGFVDVDKDVMSEPPSSLLPAQRLVHVLP